MAEENEYAPEVTNESKLPKATKFYENVAHLLRKNQDSDVKNTSIFLPQEVSNQKRASAIRAKILRLSYERYTDKTMFDNPSRLMMADRELSKLILEKNSLIKKH